MSGMFLNFVLVTYKESCPNVHFVYTNHEKSHENYLSKWA